MAAPAPRSRGLLVLELEAEVARLADERTALLALVEDVLAELSESPLEGARYAHGVVARRFGAYRP